MDFTGEAAVAADRRRVFALVRDLSTYPGWFSVVRAAEADATAEAAWVVDLGASLGPLTRTKRVRMRRTVDDEPAGRARFERDEQDGRQHSAWVLEARIAGAGAGAGDGDGDGDGHGALTLTMHLYYGGIAWVPGLDRLLRDEAKRAAARLQRLAGFG
ncbi:MAG TPA: hypothetical protein VF230_10885 [Acidimicrobiales bacterium]